MKTRPPLQYCRMLDFCYNMTQHDVSLAPSVCEAESKSASCPTKCPWNLSDSRAPLDVANASSISHIQGTFFWVTLLCPFIFHKIWENNMQTFLCCKRCTCLYLNCCFKVIFVFTAKSPDHICTNQFKKNAVSLQYTLQWLFANLFFLIKNNFSNNIFLFILLFNIFTNDQSSSFHTILVQQQSETVELNLSAGGRFFLKIISRGLKYIIQSVKLWTLVMVL